MVFLDEPHREAILKEYYKDILYRDIVPRFEVRNANKLEEIAYFVMTNISNPFNYHNIEKLTYLSFQVVKFSYYLKEQIKNTKKIYFIDTGMRNAIDFRFSQDLGRLSENLVFVDLRRRGKKVYYWKGKGEVEAMDKIGIGEGIVITDDYFGEEEIESRKIRFIPLWSWLARS